MLITNRAPYIKNYKVLKLGIGKLMICDDLLLLLVNGIYFVYKAGHLKGVTTNFGDIYPMCTAKSVDDNTKWSHNRICGIYIRTHNIPYCMYDRCVSLYGFKLMQHFNIAHCSARTICDDTLRGLALL